MRALTAPAAFLLTSFFSGTSLGLSDYDRCLLDAIKGQAATTSMAIKRQCAKHQGDTVNQNQALEEAAESFKSGVISNRIRQERESQWNRFVITPHRRNYILPYTHTSKVNRNAYEFTGDWKEEIRHSEAKFQLSFKVPMNHEDLLRQNDALYIGFTLQSWWQVYTSSMSAPFRETNYQPELFYLTPLSWKPFSGNTGIAFGIEHQSNGRSQPLSRSWNRVYANFLFEKDNFALSFRPWYRLREDDKENSGDSDGDDNPDIENFLGHFELRSAYRWRDYQFGLMVRNNLRSDNKGAMELDWSFPFFGHLRGFVQYYNGYGESMIDYNISQQRVGVGILLTDLL